MFEHVVADIYCLIGGVPCAPLEWWSSAAAWAQALLTVLTFAFALVFQAMREKRIRAEQELRRIRAESEAEEVILALFRVARSRNARRWRGAIQSFLESEFSHPRDEVLAWMQLLRGPQMNWDEPPEAVVRYGQIAASVLSLLHAFQKLQDGLTPLHVERLRSEFPDKLAELAMESRKIAGDWFLYLESWLD
ncbi:hypothetical protein QFW80_16585 [Luteimonas sp. M1R5S18]|uniref:DUF4760 domain-containing protein n=1 Tax=Luteimonas rhizosphaericola TaxID=3042024 RepID=A0ABT6JN74_9GAMM|nr:hypothetical protein [Luteimonas rhizosphaericola]MDH5832136.1 hypothetical protein [Luteimonas rhizosphaericola]